MKNDEIWYPTCGYLIKWEQSFDGLSYLDRCFLVIVVMKDMAKNIIFPGYNWFNRWVTGHWWMSNISLITLVIVLWKYFRIYANFLRKNFFVYFCRHLRRHRIISVARWHIFVKNANCTPKFTKFELFPPKSATM